MHSMTGIGSASVCEAGMEVSADVRTVNHRFLDLGIRLPKTLARFEPMVRELAGQYLRRGHADISVSFANRNKDARRVVMDEALAKSYLTAFEKLKALMGDHQPIHLEAFLAVPDLFQVESREEDEESLSGVLKNALSLAFERLCEMRSAEGKRLQQDLSEILSGMSDALVLIEKAAEGQTAQCYERVRQRVSALRAEGLDPARLAQEAAILADRCAVDEEITRLKSHIAQGKALLQEEQDQGKKLDFLCQEMNREANTIASKSQDIVLTNGALAMKNLIEKLREQVQNVE